MAILDIVINSRTYQIACDDGQENHLRSLGREIDAMVQNLSTGMGAQAADGTLLALTTLMLLDELHETREQNRQLKLQMNHHSHAFESAKQHEMDSAVAGAFEELAERVSRFTRALSDKYVANG